MEDGSVPRSPKRGAGTTAVHAGEAQTPPRPPAVTPVHLTAPFLFGSSEELVDAFASGDDGGIYSRWSNPSVRVVEEKVAALEAAESAVAYSSGMAAVAAALSSLLGSGDRLLAARDLYGGTVAWLQRLRRRHPEIRVDTAPLAGLLAAVEASARGDLTAVLVESPSNPLLACCDLESLAAACHRRGATLVVDNTFATPILQRPIELGADLVVHSATKFLSGHSDVVAGVVAGSRSRAEALLEARRLDGACLDPHAAFLVARGLRTLALRMERQAATAARLAARLERHPAVVRVYYPGDDPVARTQMRSGGAILSFELASGDAARGLLDRVELFRILPSLGGVESGVILPAVASHGHLAREERLALGITDGLVRVSCGIEDADDLERDLLTALA